MEPDRGVPWKRRMVLQDPPPVRFHVNLVGGQPQNGLAGKCQGIKPAVHILQKTVWMWLLWIHPYRDIKRVLTESPKKRPKGKIQVKSAKGTSPERFGKTGEIHKKHLSKPFSRYGCGSKVCTRMAHWQVEQRAKTCLALALKF